MLNATAAVAIATQLEVSCEDIAKGLAGFRGVDRRFQLKGCARGVNVVDDYGHHPTEIRATLSAAKESGYSHVHVIFQPHRYTRTRDLMRNSRLLSTTPIRFRCWTCMLPAKTPSPA